MIPYLNSALLLVATITAVTYDRSAVFERPTQSSIIILFASGVVLLLLSPYISKIFPSERSRPVPALHLSDLNVLHNLGEVRGFGTWGSVRSLPSRIRDSNVVAVAVAVCLRIEIFRFISANRQCFVSGVEGFLPFVLAIFDYGDNRFQLPRSDHPQPYEPTDPWTGSSNHDYRYLLPTACFAISNAFSTYYLGGPRSTYICPFTSAGTWFIPFLEVIAVIVDCYVIISVASIVQRSNSSTSPDPWSVTLIVGRICISASVIMFIGGLIAFLTHTMYWKWVWNIDRSFVGAVAWAIILFTTAVITWLQILTDHGPLHVTMFLAFTTSYFTIFQYARSDRSVLPNTPFYLAVLGPIFLLLSATRTLHTQTTSGSFGLWKPSQRLAWWLPVSTLTILVTSTVILGHSLYSSPEMPELHPIESLMRNAVRLSHNWLEQASRSNSLGQAAHAYKQRYGRTPPPGFDAWYRYAKERSALVIDDYNSMYDDLNPFWGLSPSEIQLRTQQVLSDPWNDVSGIRIRNGHADLGPNFKPTHRWMMEGIISMVEKFSTYLPDMDLAFNLNDEPRVIVPFKTMHGLLNSGTHEEGTMGHQWSPERALTWQRPDDEKASRPFGDYPRINSFSTATANCPPSSAVWKSHIWDPSKFCTWCCEPHSQGPFVSDWPLSGSPCHQPDLRNLHGFYLSPANFKTSQTLLPIFSQSKVAGFADILYPSPWNYIDKAVYDPSETFPDLPFKEKENSLFWRGGTSEGVSRHGTWKGMIRQRVVHLASNLTNTTQLPNLPLLLPHPSKEGKYSYQFISDPITTYNLPLNLSFVTEFDRAWDNDGPAQEKEFALAQPVDFQENWRYRYLLDVDGAGFSGRFLPFLQSKSLPFRTGIFRTWYDSRLTAWAHFVPVDVRLHGLLSTLAYFTGTRGLTGAKTLKGRVGMEARVTAGETIAEAGRVQAERVVRKEDMEVYMFRLLLEWGRLTDERRDEIGFVVDEGDGDDS